MSFPPNIKFMNGQRVKYTYPDGFPDWLSSISLKELEDTIGREAFNALVARFEEQQQED